MNIDEYQKIVSSAQKTAPVAQKAAPVLSIEERTLNQLRRLAKEVGKSSLFTAVKDAGTKTKITSVSGKLKELGYEFSSCPTDSEIKEAQKKYERQQELQQVDKSLILTPGKKRSSSGISDQPVAKKPNKKYTDDDEEADF